MNSNISKPIIITPMPDDEYQACRQRQIQQFKLSDENELRKDTDHQREMDTIRLKGLVQLSKEEARQRMKEKRWRVITQCNQTLVQLYNGENHLRSEEVLFTCRINAVRCFKRCDSDDYYFQLVLIDARTECESFSPLYPEKALQSIPQLKRTVLLEYGCGVSESSRKEGWENIQKNLISAYNKARVTAIEIPSKAGWFSLDGQYHFWTNADEKTQLINDIIGKFSVAHCAELEAENVVTEIVNYINAKSNGSQLAVLLVYRLAAFLGRIATNEPFPIGITLIGQNSVDVAKAFLCVMDSTVDTFNLDADRIGMIRRKMKDLQDTPAIFISSNPDSRSTQNRIREVTGWMDNGVVENTRVLIPFVFCLKNLSHSYPLDKTIVSDSDDIIIRRGEKPFAKLQALLLILIEGSGHYWVDELRHSFEKFSELEGDDEAKFPLFAAVEDVVLSMLSNRLEREVYVHLRHIFEDGRKEISHQRSLKKGILIEIFREQVIRLAIENQVFVVEKTRVPLMNSEKVIFYDDDFYFFTKNVLDRICDMSKINRRSLLYIKQQFYERRFLKTYKNLGTYSRELQVDFRVTTKDGKTEDLSGLAIKREFWDEIGGIGLFERGSGASA